MIWIFSGAAGDLLAHEIDEAAVDTTVGGEFGMEGGGEDMSLLDEDRETVALGEDFDGGAGLHDAWGADVDEFHRAAGEFCV